MEVDEGIMVTPKEEQGLSSKHSVVKNAKIFIR